MKTLDVPLPSEIVSSLIQAGVEVDTFLKDGKPFAGFQVENSDGSIYIKFEIEVDETDQDPKRWMTYDRETNRFRAYDRD